MELINKKGLFYMFTSVIFLLAIAILFFTVGTYDFRDSQEVVGSRIRTMNDFIEDLNNDAHKATFIAAYRALIAMEEEVATSGNFFSDAENVFNEAFFNGTLNGVVRNVLNASSFSDYLARVNDTANDIGLILNIEVNSISLFHKDPWSVSVVVNFTNNITDTKEVASWSYEINQETVVPIFDLRDPFYSVGTLGRVPNTIRKTNYTFFVDDGGNANDTTNLLGHANASYYIASTLAPSYVMRLEGNYSNSTFGIESLVNIEELQTQDITIESQKSIVDYIYFNPNSSATMDVCFAIVSTPSWFRIDRDHLQVYDIEPELGPEDEGYVCN